jgi:hypothetical protein
VHAPLSKPCGGAEIVHLVCFGVCSSYLCYGYRCGYGASGPDNVRQLVKRNRNTAKASQHRLLLDIALGIIDLLLALDPVGRLDPS